MRIVDLLNKDSILLGGAPTSKSEAIDMLIDLQVKGGNIADREAYKKGILAREAMSSTAVGEGIAIPHAKSEAVKAPSLAAMTVPGGVDYEAMDDEPSNLLFMIAAPNNGDVHLEVLSRLMTLLMDEDFRAKLLAADSKESFLARLKGRNTLTSRRQPLRLPRRAATEYSQLPPAPPVSRIPTWRRKRSKRRESGSVSLSRWRRTAPAAQRISSPPRRSRSATVSS